MKKYVLITFFVLLGVQLHADNFYGKRISIESGLTQSSVTSIAYDHGGSLWIGTRFGLNEYRNGKVKAYPGNYINGLLCDSNDVLWVATDRGVQRYDRATDTFATISDASANCLYENGGRIYIGGNAGMVCYDEKDGTITGGDSEVWTDILTICGYGNSILCIDKRIGITLIKPSGEEEKIEIPETDGATVMAACLNEDELVLSILGEGVLFYDLSKRQKKDYIRLGENGLSKDLILSSHVIDGNIWLGTDGNGIMILNPKTRIAESFKRSVSLNPGVSIPESVTCICQDPIGNIWIGGVYSGVTGLKRTSIRTFIPESIINTMHLSDDGRLYIGTDGEGIVRLDSKDSDPVQIKSTEGLKITSIADYDSRRLLFCAYNKGFFLLDRKTGGMSHFFIKDALTDPQEYMYGNAPEACSLGDGKILIYAVHNYLHDTRDKSFTLVEDNVDWEAKDLHVVSGNGHERYAYTLTGIFRIDQEGRYLTRTFKVPAGSGNINALACSDSLLYYGTDYGLYQLDPKDWTAMKMESNLFTRVTELCMDPTGRLWIGADNSMFMYKDGIFELIGENRGVPANEYKASTHGWDGSMYFGGSAGMLGISGVEDMFGNEEETSLHLNDVSVNGKKVPAKKGIVKVPYDFESLELTISMSGADPFERMACRYSVKGLNSYTVETFDDGIRLPTLNPGSYSVEASYLMDGGRWSSPCTVLQIIVKRAWYASIPMCILYVFLAVGALIGLALMVRKKMMEELQSKMRSRDTQFITKFENYVADHLADNDLGVEGIAEALAMSRATLYSKVKGSYDTGIGEYIEKCRMDKAKELLSTTSLSVADIAEAIGYSTPRYFSTRFKIVTGDSPLSWRKSHHS